MEINITNIIANIAPMDYSASAAEIGQDAGKITWAAACEDALELFGDQFDREAFDEYFSGFGAWSDEELAAHTDRESAALMLQFIAGDIRESDFNGWPKQWSDEWWAKYEKAASAGTVAGRIGRGDDGQIYYYVGD